MLTRRQFEYLFSTARCRSSMTEECACVCVGGGVEWYHNRKYFQGHVWTDQNLPPTPQVNRRIETFAQ